MQGLSASGTRDLSTSLHPPDDASLPSAHLDPRGMQALESSATLDMRASAVAGRQKLLLLPVAPPGAEDAPPPPPPRDDGPCALLAEWRAKALRYGTLSQHPRTPLAPLPSCLGGLDASADFDRKARLYYAKCFVLLHVHQGMFALEDVVALHVELAYFLRLALEPSPCAVLCVAALGLDGAHAPALELLDWALEALHDEWRPSEAHEQTELCVALGGLRVGCDEPAREALVRELLDAYCAVSLDAAQARLGWWAARAARLEGERKQRYLDLLLDETRAGDGPLAAAASRLLATCGDLTLVVHDGAGGQPRTVRACRGALIESSEYFTKLLDGGFREGRAAQVTLETQYVDTFCDVVLPFLYSGGRLESPLSDFDAAAQLLAVRGRWGGGFRMACSHPLGCDTV